MYVLFSITYHFFECKVISRTFIFWWMHWNFDEFIHEMKIFIKKPTHAIPSKYKTHVLSCIWNMYKQDVLRRLEESLWNVSEALWCILWMSFSRKRKAYAYFISSGRNKVYTQHWCYIGTKQMLLKVVKTMCVKYSGKIMHR